MLVDRPELRLLNLVLQAGEKVESHSVPVEVIFFALSGQGQVNVDEETVEVTQGQLLVCPADLERSLQAGEQGLSLLIVRAPNPID